MDSKFLRLCVGMAVVVLFSSACGFFGSSTQEGNADAMATPDTVQATAPSSSPTALTLTATAQREATPTRLLVREATPTAAGQAAQQSLTAGAANADTAQKGSVIFSDDLAAGWQNWSWETSTDFAEATTAVGKAAIGVTYGAAWAAFRLHRDALIRAGDVDLLRFRIHGGDTGGQKVRVVLADGGNTIQETGVTVTAVAGTWTTVEIPLAELGNVPQISGIVWQDATGGAQPTFYLDNIALVDINLPPTATPVPIAGPALTVDVTTPQHVINPDIYGINYADEALARALALPVRRWGGNGTTRYNWQLDVASHTKDWFFENIPKENANPAALPVGSQADLFIEQDRRTGTKTLMTMPMIGWTPKSREYACGFSIEKYGPQQEVDPWRPDCGNGIQPNGEFITGNDPKDTSIPVDESFVADWMAHLIGRFGNAAAGGVAYYSLDNEPMLWHETHRDVRPEPLGYDELRDRTYRYAATIKRMDPTAQTVGPALWGWTAYSYSALDQASGSSWWSSPQDRQAHDDLPLVPWYLQQMQAYEATSGVRLLDYLDLHYYPQAQGVALAPAGNAETQELRLRSTRSLWDPTYRDESWIGEPVRLIPRMREWVDANYPGTKLALTEYNWGGLDHINGAVAQADLLGIFGREGLDMALLWDPADSQAPFAYAFRIYRNYDGQGGKFGNMSLPAQSSDQEQLAVYAARRETDDALTVVVVNKSTANLRSSLQFNGLTGTTTVEHYRYSTDDLTAIVRLADQPTDGALSAEFPGYSITLFVVQSLGN
ncbi:MAG: glycoside hydrolase family 44 protein [Caldilineaceae bacterium]|nr:glycoside hydrolase family 44 protein [Caldilineaceae bacterium]